VRAAFGLLRDALEEKRRFDPQVSHRTFNILLNDYVEIFLLAPHIKVTSICKSDATQQVTETRIGA
jgi:hypothetical protein